MPQSPIKTAKKHKNQNPFFLFEAHMESLCNETYENAFVIVIQTFYYGEKPY